MLLKLRLSHTCVFKWIKVKEGFRTVYFYFMVLGFENCKNQLFVENTMGDPDIRGKVLYMFC